MSDIKVVTPPLSSLQASHGDRNDISIKQGRESSFELIRILAQFMIVFYHLFLFFIYPSTHIPIAKAIWLPFHIGVILFVLISGYFGIKPSIKGFVKLIGQMVVLYIPLQIVYIIKGGANLSSMLFISATPFWFMRTYIFLYLFAPIINFYLKSANNIKRFYLICVLAFISHYIGTIGIDPSLLDGKNIATFLFLYVIGDTIKRFASSWRKIPGTIYGSLFIFFNILLVAVFTFWNGELADLIFNKIFFSYCSFGLLVNSIIFFFWIGKLHFKSRFINSVAASSLTIYMLHGANIIFFSVIGPATLKLLNLTDSTSLIFLGTFIFTILIVSACVMVDKCLSPIWRLNSRFGAYIEKRILAYLNQSSLLSITSRSSQ